MAPFKHQHVQDSVKVLQSKAHEDDEVPGTVYLQPTQRAATAYDQAIFPVPSADPNDPLLWPQWRKLLVLCVVCFYSIIGNGTGLAPSVYIEVFAGYFSVSQARSSNIASYGILAYGVSSLIWVPLSIKFGRRATWLISLVFYLVFMIAASQAQTFEQLLIFHILGCFSCGICESVAVMVVDDIFFIHERGGKIGYYTASLCLGSLSPVPVGYLLDTGTWRSAYYVFTACGAALLVTGFFVFTETKFDRRADILQDGINSTDVKLPHTTHTEDQPADASINEALTLPKKSYLSQLNPFPIYNRQASFWLSIARSFSFLAYPAVLWTIASYGIFIGTGALFISYTFPTLIVAPPYNWPVSNSGLIAVGGGIGIILGLPIGVVSDRVAAHFTRKNNMVREPEHRLYALIPAILLLPAGTLIYGLSAYYKVHWSAMFIGNAIFQMSAYFGYVITLTYTVDCYNHNVPEMLMIICACKQCISFRLGFDLLSWIERDGLAVITAVFAVILFVISAQLFTFLGLGLRIRRATGKWRIAHMEKL